MFQLHPQLAEDTLPVGRFPLSLLLISKDANYPWCILVPQREDVFEIHHLSGEDQLQLIRESSRLAETMTSIFDAHKMNVAALGNQVRQLHLHHVARFQEDPAWPKPIWGVVEAKSYDPKLLEERLELLRNALVGEDFEVLK
ncbi:HIT domain-containing protein [Marinimicrobium sp. ABcell2]|uniref:HIT domain-containing protein n=1 Tax=Marinimicrobium sp. ABcell2 TaxID=3069751 RepID=UPI0027B6FA9A|nr:HIT domain-containing protein [Marinimicrobium sp. ABcell2]MDQ2075419.1 HIT domain-containing protein [Marinimicrobium sp. ABcell2]